MDQKLYDLLKRIQASEKFFRPENESDEANIAFKSQVNQLHELKNLEYIRLSDKGFIKNHTNGKGYFNIVGPCEITYKGEQALVEANEEWTKNSHTESLQIINPRAEVLQTLDGSEKTVVESTSSKFEIRLHQLSDSITQDFELLKRYEDALRLEDDPRRCARYENEIKNLKTSAEEYERQYHDLESKLPANNEGVFETHTSELSLVHKKLDALLIGQITIHDHLADLRGAVLNRYDAGEQKMLKRIVEKIDQVQVKTVESVLEAVEQDQISEGEMLETLESIQKTLFKIEDQGSSLIPEQKKFVDAINDPQLNVKHKLKLTIPLVPLLLNYETELEASIGLNLGTTWKNLKDNFFKK